MWVKNPGFPVTGAPLGALSRNVKPPEFDPPTVGVNVAVTTQDAPEASEFVNPVGLPDGLAGHALASNVNGSVDGVVVENGVIPNNKLPVPELLTVNVWLAGLPTDTLVKVMLPGTKPIPGTGGAWLSSSVIIFPLPSATAASMRPSPLKSPTATEFAEFPALNVRPVFGFDVVDVEHTVEI